MNNPRSHPNPKHNRSDGQGRPDRNNSDKERDREKCKATAQKIVGALKTVQSLRDYPIRDLVQHAKDLGSGLADLHVKTNQLRKFLDAINQLKAKLNLESEPNITNVEITLQMLKPKLAYAVGRVDKRKEEYVGLKSLEEVIAAAVDKMTQVKTASDEDLVAFREDFQRLVNLVEAIIAYHKFAGGENQ